MPCYYKLLKRNSEVNVYKYMATTIQYSICNLKKIVKSKILKCQILAVRKKRYIKKIEAFGHDDQ